MGMKNTLLTAALLPALVLAGCGADTTTGQTDSMRDPQTHAAACHDLASERLRAEARGEQGILGTLQAIAPAIVPGAPANAADSRYFTPDELVMGRVETASGGEILVAMWNSTLQGGSAAISTGVVCTVNLTTGERTAMAVGAAN